MRLRNLGFKTHAEWRQQHDDSLRTFDGDGRDYTLWQRIRLALLFLWGVDLTDLHIPWRSNRGPTIDKVCKWMDKAREHPEFGRALKAADEAFGDEEEEGKEQNEDLHRKD